MLYRRSPRRPAVVRCLLAFLVAIAGMNVPVALAAEMLRPTRAAKPPVLDGVLDDEIWQSAPRLTGFKTWQPDYGVPAADQTEVYAAYDAENMYFAFRVFDSDPSKIKASMASRDSIRPDDWICINLDSFNDQQSLYGFYVNPLGIQMDTRYAANHEDIGFDVVWYSAGRIDDRGFVVEIRIPFKSIRYGGGSRVTMGVVFERNNNRRSEGSTYPALDPKAGTNFLIQTMPMAFEDIKHYTLLEVLPDATYSRQSQARGGSLARTASERDFGVTAKYGVTAQLTADGTYNPDFSQVEADAGQIDINLRHPLFFAEKRPFFLEGAEVFNLGGPTVNGVFQNAVHTRSIANPLGGVKLSGKVSRLDTVAVLYAVDDAPAEGTLAGGDRGQVSVVRYKHSLNQDSYVGGFYVGREQGAGFNRTGGVDGSLRVNQSTAIGFHAFEADTSTGDAAGSHQGHAVGVDVASETRRSSLYFAALDVSKAFETQTGYLTRNGLGRLLAAGGHRLFPKSEIVRRLQGGWVVERTRDAFSGMWEGYNELNWQMLLPRATKVTFMCEHSSEIFLDERFSTSGCNSTLSTQLRKQLRVQATIVRANAIYYTEDPLQGRSTRGTLTVVYQPDERWYTALGLTYANFNRTDTSQRLYDYTIARSKTTFQLNRYLFFRAILEYNDYKRQLMTDFLASFTYIPGTVIHAGYGSLYEKVRWDGSEYVRDRSLLETRRGLFLKASYLWRL